MTEPSWQKYWQKYQELGSYGQVAKHFDVNPSVVSRSINRAANRGEINLTPYQNPPGFDTRKVTVQTDAEGTIVQEWRRIVPQAADIEEWVNDLCHRAGKAGPKIKPPKVKGDTALEIPIGDLHVGLYSWKPETGSNWDTDKACDMFVHGVDHLMGLAPKTTKHAILADLGDFLHSDNRSGTTEKSGNVLDMDGRFCRIIDKARDAWIDVIERAAARFPSVHVVMVNGNHNWHSAHFMARIVSAYFRHCKHVNVDLSPAAHRYHKWGRSLFGYSHGHLIKPPQMASTMATAAPQWWSETYHHLYRFGHIHHATRHVFKDHEESDGVIAESFGTIIPRDSYHAERGYLSRRLMQGILHHAEHGEVARHSFHARMAEES